MTTRYVTPNGAGNLSGTSFADAAPVAAVQSLHDSLATAGDEIQLYPTLYPAPTNPWLWSKRIPVKGRNATGAPAAATFEGNRTKVWPANGVWTDSGVYTAGNAGTNVFHYKDAAAAAGGTSFDSLAFLNVGTPFRPLFSSSSVEGQITLSRVLTRNTNGLVYVESSGDGQCSISASQCNSWGYSEGMFRAFGDILLADCYGHAQNQFHSPSTNLFGAHVQDAIVGVTTRKYKAQFIRCSFFGHYAAAPAGSSRDPAITGKYPQGDCIACEENTLFLPSYDLLLVGSADRGIDLKCAINEGDLTRLVAYANQYNIGVHDDTALTVLVDSYLGPSWSPAYRPDKSALIQGSGKLVVKRSLLEQNAPAGQPAGKFFIAKADGQAAHLQSGVNIPDRIGKITLQDSTRRMGAGVGLANIAAVSFGTPSYNEINVLAA